MTECWWKTSFGATRVLVIAAPFGFGPRIAADHLCERLDLAMGAWNKAPMRLPPGNLRFDVLLNFGVEGTLDLSTHIPFSVWIDCLLWLRDVLPDSAIKHDLVLGEHFFELKPNLLLNQPNILEIQPLYESPSIVPPSETGGLVLVSFGGVITPYSTDSHRVGFPHLLLKSILRASSSRKSPTRVVCCGPPAIINLLSIESDLSGIMWDAPDRPRYLAYLRACDILVVQPGLYGPFEAFESYVNTVLSPPFSCTQIWQSLAFQSNGLMGAVPLLGTLSSAIDGTSFNTESEQLVFSRLDEWFHTHACSEEVSMQLEDWAGSLLSSSDRSQEMKSRRRTYVENCRQFPSADEILVSHGIVK